MRLNGTATLKTTQYEITLSVLYGCDTWFVILREDHRLQVFENKVHRKIFGLKTVKQFKVLHNVEIYGLYRSPSIFKVKKSRWGQ
jgi:hypothetical protein